MKFVQQTALFLFVTLCTSVAAMPFDGHDINERDYFLIQKIKEEEKEKKREQEEKEKREKKEGESKKGK